MLAACIFIVSLLVGFSSVQFLRLSLYKFETACVAGIFGLLLTTWTLFICCFLLGYSVGIPLSLSILCAGSGAGVYVARSKPKKKYLILSPKQKSIFAAYIVFCGVSLWLLFSSHLFQPKNDGWYSSGSTWGDLALHSTLINFFEQQQTPSLQSPVFAEQKLTYPFLFDFFTAMLYRSGFSLRTSLLVTSIYVGLIGVSLCFFLIKRITNATWAAVSGIFLLCLNSNLGLFYFFSEWWHSNKPFFLFLFHLQEGYVHYDERGLNWPQFLFDYFLPQRGILVGFTVFLAVLCVLHQLVSDMTAAQTKKHFFSQSALYGIAISLGLLPLFHVHTFLVICGVVVWFTTVGLYAKKLSYRTVILPFAIIGLLSAPQLLWQFSQTFHSGFLSVMIGWLSERTGNSITYLWSIPLFWLRNIGLELILAVVGAKFILKSKEHTFLRLLTVPLGLVFIICNILIFQPNAWDNTKFMIYSHFIFIILTLISLQKIKRIPKVGKVVLWLSFSFLLAGGGVATLKEAQTSWQMSTNADIFIAQQIQQLTPPGSIFLAGDSHRHPVTMLAGRPVLLGYRGWLWTYGIAYKPVERDVFALFSGGDQTISLLQKYAVSYVYIGDGELAVFQANEPFFQAHFQKIIDQPEARVYAVHQPL